jgi:pimeloyl-ACP methyl ester carboxylesterase
LITAFLSGTHSFSAPTLPAPAAPPSAIFQDPPQDSLHPARMEVLHIPTGGGVKINGVAYLPAGARAHPTLVICHGLPGNEKNLDLAQAVRRAGWNAITFNYRGSWGSAGSFRFAQVPEDVAAVLAWLRTPEVAARLGVEPRRIALAGHSMGAWATARVAAADPQLIGAITISLADLGAVGKLTRPELVKLAGENAESLADTSPERMADELMANAQTFSVLLAAKGLARMPLLVLSSDDGFAGMSNGLVAAIRAEGGKHVTTRHVATDHGWSGSRIALETVVIEWLQGLLWRASAR